MKITDIVQNPPMTIASLLLTALMFWGWGCPAQTESLLQPEVKITRPELQIELDTIIATAEFRLAELDKQDAMRDIVFNNALMMIENGSINPAGILTMLAGLYGVTRGATDIRARVKKRTEV